MGVQLWKWTKETYMPEYYYGAVSVSMPENASAGANWTTCRTAWERETNLEGFPNLTRFAFTSPIWVFGTLVVSAWNTLGHVRRASERDPKSGHETLWRQPSRNCAIWILQLPVVYGITGLFAVRTALARSVQGASDCMTDPGMHDFEFETALSFGDAYEGVALLLFASITLYVIKARIDKIVDEAQRIGAEIEQEQERSEQEAAKGEFLGADGSGFQRADSAKFPGHWNAPEMEEEQKVGTGRPRANTVSALTELAQWDKYLEHITEKMAESTSDLGKLGIVYFSVTCIVQAAPAVFACQARVGGYMGVYNAARAMSESSMPTVKGMGLLGSCVAIHNMIAIEKAFERDFLEDYKPTGKFISVKIMVSIVFIQEMFLPILFGLSVQRAQLLDATLRTLEFFLISIFNIRAWDWEEGWYNLDVTHIEPEKDMDMCKALDLDAPMDTCSYNLLA